MIDVKVKDSDIRKAVEEGMDSFVQVFVDAIGNAIDNKLTLETMQQLNADQITLLVCPVDIQWLWCFYLQKSFCRSNAQLGNS